MEGKANKKKHESKILTSESSTDSGLVNKKKQVRLPPELETASMEKFFAVRKPAESSTDTAQANKSAIASDHLISAQEGKKPSEFRQIDDPKTKSKEISATVDTALLEKKLVEKAETVQEAKASKVPEKVAEKQVRYEPGRSTDSKAKLSGVRKSAELSTDTDQASKSAKASDHSISTQEGKAKPSEFRQMNDPKTKSKDISATVDTALQKKKLVEKAETAKEAKASKVPEKPAEKQVLYDLGRSTVSEEKFFAVRKSAESSTDTDQASKSTIASDHSISTQEGKTKPLEFQRMDDPKTTSKGISSIIAKALLQKKLIEKAKAVKEAKASKVPNNLAKKQEGYDPEGDTDSIEELFKVRKPKKGENERKERNGEPKKLKVAEREPEAKDRKMEKEEKMSKMLEEKGDHTKTRKRNDQTPDDIFGYLSQLHLRKRGIGVTDKSSKIFEPETETISESEEATERDMTWLVQLSGSEEEKSKHSGHFDVKTKNSAAKSFWLFWWFVRIGGRMPFYFAKKSASNLPTTCRMKANSCNFVIFVLSTLFLVCLTLISTLNLILIIVEEEVRGEAQLQIEKLLFEKNKAIALIFLTSLMLASISSINTLIHGASMAKYMTLWTNILDEFNFKSGTGILAATITYIVWSMSLFLLHVVVFGVTILNPKFNPLIEGTHLLVAMVFRSFVPNVLIQVNNDESATELGIQTIQSSPHLWMYGAFVTCLYGYALYCSQNFVIMVVLYSIGNRNMASEWNIRLRLILQQCRIKGSEHFLLQVNKSLTYEKMFDWHRQIVDLMQENSKVFSTILVTFYMMVVVVFGTEVFELAIYTVGTGELTFNLNESAHLYEFERTSSDHLMYLCFYTFQTIGFFLFVSLLLVQTGTEVMDGLIALTKHNYMNVNSTHRRNFFMSLSMSLSARKPHFLEAGVFTFDRTFIFAFFAFFMFFYSVMIQILHSRILNIPIVVECPPDSGQFCLFNRRATVEEMAIINNANEAGALKYQIPQEKQLRTIITTNKTTAIKPGPSCWPLPPSISVTAAPQIVNISINNDTRTYCCLATGISSIICHLNVLDRVDKCPDAPPPGRRSRNLTHDCSFLRQNGSLCDSWDFCLCHDMPTFSTSNLNLLTSSSVLQVTCT